MCQDITWVYILKSRTFIALLTDFGDDLLARVVDHFRDHLQEQGVELGAIEPEWTELKQLLYNTDR